MSSGDDYGRGIPAGFETSNDPLGNFIRKTIEEARMQVVAKQPGIPLGMMPLVAIDDNAPLSPAQLKFVMNAFVLQCADELRREGMPGVPAGMIAAVNLGPPPVPEKVAVAKLEAFVQKAAEFGLTFPPALMPATGPQTVLPVVEMKPPEQKSAAPAQEPVVNAAPAVPVAASKIASPPAEKNDGPEVVSARPDRMRLMNTINPALIAAAKNGKTEEVRAQIRKGAEANAGDDAKETAVHAAIKGNHADALRVLLLNGGDPFQKSAAGQSPMDIAQQKKNPAIMAVFDEPAVKKAVSITINMNYPKANRPSFTP